MNDTVSKTSSITRILIVDAMVLATICVVPALSHLFALPLYLLNPMTLCLMAGMLLVNDKRNAYMLALLLPLVSMMVSGMPIPSKCVCMVAELLAIVGVYQIASQKIPTFFAIFTALLCGKGVFYLLKAIVVAPAVLIGTGIGLQLSLTLLYAMLFWLLSLKR